MVVIFYARGSQSRRRGQKGGFTLVEMLVSITVLLMIMGILLSMTQQTSSLWKNTSGKIEGFRSARAAFDAMTRTIRQATLNTYFDYQDAAGNWAGSSSFTTPSKYARQSNLHFICGQGRTLLGSSPVVPVTHAIFFQAPLGYSTAYTTQQQLLNACGFYIAYGPDPNVPSFLGGLNARYRYRLMEFLQPSENLQVYQTASGPTAWFTQPISGTYPNSTYGLANFVLAENVVALVIWPKLSAGDQATGATLTTDYSYDSRNANNALTVNQLPPVVEVTMITIDETSALHLGNPSGAPNAAVGITPTIFNTATQSQFQADLQNMESTLTTSHLNFQVYQTEVAIAGAKWTAP